MPVSGSCGTEFNRSNKEWPGSGTKAAMNTNPTTFFERPAILMIAPLTDLFYDRFDIRINDQQDAQELQFFELKERIYFNFLRNIQICNVLDFNRGIKFERRTLIKTENSI